MLLPTTMLPYWRYIIHFEHKHWFHKGNHFLFSKAVDLTFHVWIWVLIVYFIILCNAGKTLSIRMVITIASSTSGLILSAVILIAIIFVHQSRKKMLHEFMKSKYYPHGMYFHSLFIYLFHFAWTIPNLDNSIHEFFEWSYIHYDIRF